MNDPRLQPLLNRAKAENINGMSLINIRRMAHDHGISAVIEGLPKITDRCRRSLTNPRFDTRKACKELSQRAMETPRTVKESARRRNVARGMLNSISNQKDVAANLAAAQEREFSRRLMSGQLTNQDVNNVSTEATRLLINDIAKDYKGNPTLFVWEALRAIVTYGKMGVAAVGVKAALGLTAGALITAVPIYNAFRPAWAPQLNTWWIYDGVKALAFQDFASFSMYYENNRPDAPRTDAPTPSSDATMKEAIRKQNESFKFGHQRGRAYNNTSHDHDTSTSQEPVVLQTPDANSTTRDDSYNGSVIDQQSSAEASPHMAPQLA